MLETLLGKTPVELKEAALKVGLPAFAGKQIARWMYDKKVRSIDEMTNISKAGRERLKEEYDLGVIHPSACQESVDGTRKYLFPLGGGDAVEAVMIPDDDRKTLCVSSQAGCRMGCKFCMTGRQGFHGNLSVAGILSQFIAIEESGSLTNAVFMGMGEPLDNFDNVLRAIEVLTSDSPFPDERAGIMPVQKAWPLEEVIALLHDYDFTGQRRVSFEYTMFAGLNDDKRHADALIRLLAGIECRVNLIRFHRIPDAPFEPSPQIVMEKFRDRLSNHGITCTIRASRGEDIMAACGMLAGEHRKNQI